MCTLKKIERLCKFILDFVFDTTYSEQKLNFQIKDEYFYKKSPQDLALTIFSYKQKEIREMIHSLKYQRNRLALKICGDFLAEEILKVSKKADLRNAILIPIPRSKERLRRYGFNQCELLCREILKNPEIKKLNLIFMPKILVQNKNFETQTKLSRQNRIENARQSFFVKSPERIRGQKIILIDDVWTTGATLLDAERALKISGVEIVYKFTIAH